MAKRRLLPAIVGNRVRPRIRSSTVIGQKFGKRQAMIIVRFAAERRFRVRIRYTRIQDGVTKMYVLEPYSFRYRRTREGLRKMLFAYHPLHGRIHNFAVRYISQAEVMERPFRPRWRVELKQNPAP